MTQWRNLKRLHAIWLRLKARLLAKIKAANELIATLRAEKKELRTRIKEKDMRIADLQKTLFGRNKHAADSDLKAKTEESVFLSSIRN